MIISDSEDEGNAGADATAALASTAIREASVDVACSGTEETKAPAANFAAQAITSAPAAATMYESMGVKPEGNTRGLDTTATPAATVWPPEVTMASAATARHQETATAAATFGPPEVTMASAATARHQATETAAATFGPHEVTMASAATAKHQATATAAATFGPHEVTMASAATTRHQATAATAATVGPHEVTVASAATARHEQSTEAVTMAPAATMAATATTSSAPRGLEVAATARVQEAAVAPAAEMASNSAKRSAEMAGLGEPPAWSEDRSAALEHFFRAHKNISAENATSVRGSFDKLRSSVPEITNMMQDLSVQGLPASEAPKLDPNPAQPTVCEAVAPPVPKKPRLVYVTCIPEPGDYIVCGGRKSQVLGLQVANSEDACEEFQAGHLTAPWLWGLLAAGSIVCLRSALWHMYIS